MSSMNKFNANEFRRTTYKEQVTSLLRESILRGDLAPGTPLVSSALSNQLGISRGPIREALSELQKEGLVVQLQHRTAHVASLDPKDAWEVYTLRASLEVLALRLGLEVATSDGIHRLLSDLREIAKAMIPLSASSDLPDAVDCDLRFHSRICEFGGHSRLRESQSNLDALIGALFVSIRKNFQRTFDGMAGRHFDLVDIIQSAIAEKDYARAEDALWQHHHKRAKEFLTLVDEYASLRSGE